MKIDDIRIKGYTLRGWPVDTLRELHAEAAKDNWLLRVNSNSFESMLKYWMESEAAIFLAYGDDDVCLGGMVVTQGDSHVERCTNIEAALIRQGVRGTRVTLKLYRSVKSLAMFVGSEFICTTEYMGNGQYSTKYRRQ